MEKSKYYTPEIKEFCPEFEFKYRGISTAQWVSGVFKIEWQSEDMNIADWLEGFDVRVKYLDREDIESLGFTEAEKPSGLGYGGSYMILKEATMKKTNKNKSDRRSFGISTINKLGSNMADNEAKHRRSRIC